MGKTHSISGACLALASAPALTAAGIPVSGWGIGLLAVAGAGGAMFPDYDHRHATLSYSLWPVSKWIAIGVEKLSGGHRNGTHSIVGTILFAALSFGLVTAGGWFAGIWTGLLLAAGLAGLQMKFTAGSATVHTLLTIIGTILIMGSSVAALLDFRVVFWGSVIGYISHLLGDMLTKGGIPILFPFSRQRFAVASITTGSVVERGVVFVLLNVIFAAQMVWLTGMWHLVQSWSSFKVPQPGQIINVAVDAARSFFAQVLARVLG